MSKEKGKPNIVYIMADDMGYGDLSCYGASKIETPNMDRIAEQGVRFTDAHSASAVCTPSRYGVLTGRYCWRSRLKHGVLGGFGAPFIPPERLTTAGMLKRCGYHTAAIGKWHLGFHWSTKDGRLLSESAFIGWDLDGFDVDYTKPLRGGPRDLGFDYFFGIAGSLDMPPYCFIENDGTFGIPSLEKTPYEAQQRRGLMTEGWRDDQVDITFARKATAFIEGHVKSKAGAPFFLYVTPSAPHRPCVPPDFVRGKSRAGLRGDAVMLVDWLVGQILEALAKHGLTDNTLVIATSDNGAWLTNFDGKDYGHKSNGDLRGGKADIWDGGHREPLVAMWPGLIKPGSVCDETICLTDLMGTCADIVGTNFPADAGEDSASILPLLKGERLEKPLHEAIVHHAGDGMFAIRKGPWKYIDGLGSGGFTEPVRYDPRPGEALGQLYHVHDNYRESLNLWIGRRDIVKELSELLEKYKQGARTV